ncbi:MAG: Transcriptional regulator, HxlR family, partial [uncultured Rubrobacteraceae bacterium]
GEKTAPRYLRLRAPLLLPGRGDARRDRRQVEGRRPLPPGRDQALRRAAASDPGHQPAHADVGAQGARGRRVGPPRGLPGGAAQGGVQPDRIRGDALAANPADERLGEGLRAAARGVGGGRRL